MTEEEAPFRRRKSLRLSQASLVRTGFLDERRGFPLVVEPTVEGLNLAAWAEGCADFVDAQLNTYGALLFRGFTTPSLHEFERFVGAAGGALPYTERSSPRTRVSGNIYTSTDYPPEYPIFLHNEQSYNLSFPARIIFCCLTPAESGGQTPIADTRRVLRRISADTRRRFEERGYMYTRNFGSSFGLSWQTAFQTNDPLGVESYCRDNAIQFEWKSGGRLKTWQVRRVTATHPQTGEAAWFNHAAFFHVTTLEPEIQARLRAEVAEEDLPNNTYYGDGSAIEPTVIEELRAAYLAEKTLFSWRRGDVLALDNMLSAHGREPYAGPRQVITGMSKLCGWNEV